MAIERDSALERLDALGFRGADVYLAEMIPAVEMAWADGEVHPNEVALLEVYCQTLINTLNAEAGGRFFSVRHALKRLRRCLARRLSPAERHGALLALQALSAGTRGAVMRSRMLEWTEAVAAMHGSPVLETRERFWLQNVKRVLEAA